MKNSRRFALRANQPALATTARAASLNSTNTRVIGPRQRRQQHLLDVRVRAREVNRHRRQSFFYWLSLTLLTLAGVGGAYLVATRGVAKLFYQNPDYNIVAVNIETDGVLSRDQVLDCAGLQEGMNIFKVNLDRARERLEKLPQVLRAQIQRQLPNRVSILITERRPVAWIAPENGPVQPGKISTPLSREEVCGSRSAFLVDASGTLMRPQKLLAQNLSLPIIRGCSTNSMISGGKVDTDEIYAALNLIDIHQSSLLGARFQIQDIDVSRGYGLLVTDRNNTQVFFALEELELQLKMLDTLLRMIDATGKRPATISLATMAYRQRNIPVTFRSDTPADPSSLTTAGPLGQTGTATVPTSAPPLVSTDEKNKYRHPQQSQKSPASGRAARTTDRSSSRSRQHASKAQSSHAPAVGGFRGRPAATENEPRALRALPVQ